MKKITSLILVVVMYLSLCIPAFAAERARIEIIVENKLKS